jgi:hypothetical protein
MKKLIFILFAALIALPSFAQRLNTWTAGPDTSTTTVKLLTGGGEYNRAFNYDARIFVDVTGTEAAVLRVEYKPFGGTNWYVAKQWTGISADGYYSHSGYLLGGTMRVSILSTDSGSAAATAWVSVNPRNPKANRVLETWADGPDTSATTVQTLTGGSSFGQDTYYDAGIFVDVISDTATLYVDVLPFGSAVWIPVDTVASIMADTYYFYQGSIVGGAIRARILSTGTGSTAARIETQYARKED